MPRSGRSTSVDYFKLVIQRKFRTCVTVKSNWETFLLHQAKCRWNLRPRVLMCLRAVCPFAIARRTYQQLHPQSLAVESTPCVNLRICSEERQAPYSHSAASALSELPASGSTTLSHHANLQLRAGSLLARSCGDCSVQRAARCGDSIFRLHA